jgi:hypothetical protein
MKPRYISARNLRTVDWDIFQDTLLKFEFKKELNQESSNDEFWKFHNFILNELYKVAPLKSKRIKGFVNPWFTSEVKYFCHVRNSAKKLAIRTKSSDDWKSYRVARNKANGQITKAKKAYFSKKFREKVSSQCLWDTVNELTGFRKNEKNPGSVLDN